MYTLYIYNMSGESLLTNSLNGNLTEVTKLLNAEVNVNTTNVKGDTALILASKNGHLEIVKLLIEKTARVNLQNLNGNTPLYVGTLYSRLEIVKLLIENGADVNLQSKNYGIPLFVALQNGYLDITKLLIESGANLNVRNAQDYTLLMLAIQKGQLEIVEILIAKGVEMEAMNRFGINPIMVAVHMGNLDIVKILVKNGVNIKLKHRTGNTLITEAEKHGHLHIMEYFTLLESQHINNNKPLMVAAKNGKWNIVKRLVTKALFKNKIRLKNKIGKCATTQAKLRIEHVYTMKKWNLKSDRFVDFDDGYCYSLKEIRDMYIEQRVKSPFTGNDFTESDIEKINIIGDLLLPIKQFEVEDSEIEVEDSEINVKNEEKKGGHIKSRKNKNKRSANSNKYTNKRIRNRKIALTRKKHNMITEPVMRKYQNKPETYTGKITDLKNKMYVKTYI